MKDSLLNLQRGIGLREYSSEAEEKRSPYHWHPTRRPRGHAVQYETCFLWSSMQAAARHTVRERERESGQRGRRDQQWAGPIDTERGTVVSSTQRLKPPGGENHGPEVPLPHTVTEVYPTSLRHCGKVRGLLLLFYLWKHRFLLLSYFQVHPTVSRVDQVVPERPTENYCMHLDNLGSLSQC